MADVCVICVRKCGDAGRHTHVCFLGHQVIVLTDQVPNELPLVGGLITEAFQTPLAHVNLLARNRGTPNLALRDAKTDARIAPLIGELVRLEVSEANFNIRIAAPEEAALFWDARAADQPVLEPRLDTTVRWPQALSDHDLTSLPALGAKASQLAQLSKVDLGAGTACSGLVSTPRDAFAVPVVHSIEHIKASGAQALLNTLLKDAAFLNNPNIRAARLEQVRAAIMTHPVEPDLLARLVRAISARFNSARVRMRSSSNTEDLPGFNGAGLYTSVSAKLGEDSKSDLNIETG